MREGGVVSNPPRMTLTSLLKMDCWTRSRKPAMMIGSVKEAVIKVEWSVGVKNSEKVRLVLTTVEVMVRLVLITVEVMVRLVLTVEVVVRLVETMVSWC